MSEHTDPNFFNRGIFDPIDNPHQHGQIPGSSARGSGEPRSDPVMTATLLLKSRAVRTERLGDHNIDIDDISWHILLDLLVSMDIGKPVVTHDLAITHHVAKSTMSRYVAYLMEKGLIISNADVEDEERAELILSASGVDLAQTTLKEICRQLASQPECQLFTL